MFRFGRIIGCGADRPRKELPFNGNIVRNSLKVIGNNEQRYRKDLEAVRDNRACLHIQELKDPNEEAQYAADEIEGYIRRGIPEGKDCRAL